MSTEPSAVHGGSLAAVLNLVLPGGGLIVLDSIGSGLIVGLLFVACANFALVSVLLFPDDFSPTVQALGVGLAAGSYVGAQVRLAKALRRARTRAFETWRRGVLWTTRILLERGEHGAARDAILPLAQAAPDDLLVQYRLVQALVAAGELPDARAACERLKRLDRRGIYRAQVRDIEQQLVQRADETGNALHG